MSTHRLLEAHSGDVASHSRVLLVAATQSVFVEVTFSDGLLKSRTLHLVHVHWTHSWKKQSKVKDQENQELVLDQP